MIYNKCLIQYAYWIFLNFVLYSTDHKNIFSIITYDAFITNTANLKHRSRAPHDQQENEYVIVGEAASKTCVFFN